MRSIAVTNEKVPKRHRISNTSVSNIEFDTTDFSITSTTSSIENKFISFKSQLVTNNTDKLETTIKNLDTLKLDPNTVVNNLTVDIIIVILYLSAFISHIGSLILLYSDNNKQSMYYISFSLLIVGALINTIWAFFYGIDILFEYTSNKLLRILGVTGIMMLSLFIGPLMFLYWVKYAAVNETFTDHRRCINLLLHSLGTSFGQSILMTVVVLMNNNIWYTISLFSSISLVIIALILVSIEHEEFTVLKFMPLNDQYVNDSFLFYLLSYIIDYICVLFWIVCCYYDQSDILMQLWFYNTLIGVPFILLITYHEAKYFMENFSPVNKYLYIGVSIGIYLLYFIFFQIIVEMTCSVWVIVIYNYIKRYMSEIYVADWHLLQWIAKDECIKRLCIVNGLVMDRCHEENGKLNANMLSAQKYVRQSCINNFECVSLKGLKPLKEEKSITHIAGLILFDDIDSQDFKSKFKIFAILLFVFSRIVRFIFLPLFVIFSKNEFNAMVYVVIGVQILFVLVILKIIRMVWMELKYSLYMVSYLDLIIKHNVRKEIGFYYNALSIHELHAMINVYLGSDIAHVIVSYMSGENFIEDGRNRVTFEDIRKMLSDCEHSGYE